MISVIVPVYKAEEYLDRCVESIVNQTYKNLEIILVDDGSPDRCGEMCDEWAKKDYRIKVIHKENGGAGDAKSVGLKSASGDFIGLVDADDIVSPYMYEELRKLIDDYNADIADSVIKKINSYDEVDFSRPKAPIISTYSAQEALCELMNDKVIRQTPCNKLYKKEVVEGIYFPKGRYIDDEFWTYKVIAKARKYVLTDEHFYFYLQHSESAMGMKYSLKRLDAIDALYERYLFMKEHFPDLEECSLYSYIGACKFHYQMLCFYDDVDPDKIHRQRLFELIKKSDLAAVRKHYKGKQRVWFEAFLTAPEFTSKIRNMFKIGW